MRKNELRVVRCGLRVSVSPFTTRYSPIAAVSRLADLPTSRLADKFWEGELSGEPNLGARCGVRLSSQNFRQCRSTATQNYSLLAIRQSLPFLALTGGSCSSTTEFFRHGRSRALQKNHSPLAIRYSLPFRLGRSLAFPIHSVPRPPSHAPF
jgi:hypothetical protein